MNPRSMPTSRWRFLFLLLGLVVAAGPLLAARPVQAATTFTVTTVGDNPDAAPGDGRCDTTLATTNAPCSLRAAIQEANATAGPDTIAFAIPGTGVKTIRPASALPAITEQVTINGYSQPGAKPNTAATGTNAVLLIELDGTNAGDEANGLVIRGSNTLVRGLVVNRFLSGIVVEGGAWSVRIEGCFLGTDAAGTAALGNDFGVVANGAPDTRIGGPTPAARNLIADNGTDGVFLRDALFTRVLGNLIGTTRTGTGDLGNGDDGVYVDGWADLYVGGATAGQANTIAFNDGAGVVVDDASIGVRILRNSIFANAGLGIDLGDDGATPNDPNDPDQGANILQNFPVIRKSTSTAVSGSLNSTRNQTFALRLFSNPGNGNEGKFFEEGPLLVTTDGNGSATFAFTPDPPIPAGRTVTATATNTTTGSTSEFSAAKAVTGS